MKKSLSLIICVLIIVSTILPLSASGVNSTYNANVTEAVVSENLNATTAAPVVDEIGEETVAPVTEPVSYVSTAAVDTSVSTLSDESTAKIICSVSQEEAHRGDTITVSVSLSDCEDVRNLAIMPEFDESAFELVSSGFTPEIENIASVNAGDAVMFQKYIHIEGLIYKYVLRVKDDVEFNSIDVSVVSGKVLTSDKIQIKFNIDSATVNITCRHEWNSVDSIAPTCVSEGYIDYNCPICGDTKHEVLTVDPDAHNWEYSHYVDYTCTEDGYSVYKCTWCGAEKKDDFVPAAHRYIDTVFDASPAAKRGFTMHTCTVCGYSYKDNFTFYEETARAKAYVETVYGSAGDTVEVSVIVENAGDLKMLSIKDLNYDESKLELVKAGWKVKGLLSDWDPESKSGVCAFSVNTPVDGAVFTFTFKLSNDVLDYETPVSCTVTARTKPVGGIETDVEFDNYGGKVWVSVFGDVSGDNYVDSDDAIYLLKHVVDKDNYDYELNQEGDFNGDGYVDSDDAIYLLYHTLLPERFPLYN